MYYLVFGKAFLLSIEEKLILQSAANVCKGMVYAHWRL
jgi:hypothetical protein